MGRFGRIAKSPLIQKAKSERYTNRRSKVPKRLLVHISFSYEMILPAGLR